MLSLHALVQECSRAIASHESPAQSFCDVAGILKERTGAADAAVLAGGLDEEAHNGIIARAIHERRACIETLSEGTLIVAVPIKNAGCIFGVLRAVYTRDSEQPACDHSTSDLISAVGLTLGNALALAERVPPAGGPAHDSAAYDEYVRAHLELYRSYHVPFAIALYDLRDKPPSVHLAAPAALRWCIRCSDAVFALEDGLFAVLLANCPLSGAYVATQRIEQNSGLRTRRITTPRRGDSARRLQARCISPENSTGTRSAELGEVSSAREDAVTRRH